MLRFVLPAIFSILSCTTVFAQHHNNEEQVKYRETVTKRAEKIVSELKITDSSKFVQVRDIVAQQYIDLNDIHAVKNAQLQAVKGAGLDKDGQAAKTAEVGAAARRQLDSLHKEYLRKLAMRLHRSQVDQVKDGMTYGVLPITYSGYLDMLPNLTRKQKKQIRTWLTEARELAMDAESSEKKHATFGKYKGRINNYLSAAGIDMKKSSKEWEERLRARATAAGKN